MKKHYQHIALPPHLEAFRRNYLAATEVEATLCGIITCYKMYGAYFIRTKSSLTGKRVKRDKRFRRTMHNAGILARASEWVTPVYNSLTEDWRCQDLYRKLVGLGVKLLHQGATKEDVQQAAWVELARLGYQTEWPTWEMPPELAKWVEEETRKSVPIAIGREDRKSGSEKPEMLFSLDDTKEETDGIVHKKPVQAWVVNSSGKLVLEGLTSNAYYPTFHTIGSIASGYTLLQDEVAMPPPV
jgi:hypothetical protein